MNRVLRNAGVDVGHEHMKREGTVSMFFAVEDVWYPGKHWNDDGGVEDEQRQRRSDYVFGEVWHIVRDPRRVIPSLCTHSFQRFIWPWQERHTGISAGLYPVEVRAMRFWVAWNELIEKNESVDLFFRVEDIDARWSEMRERLGITDCPEVPPVERDYGTVEKGPRKTVPLSFEDMASIDAKAAARVQEMAARYGYE